MAEPTAEERRLCPTRASGAQSLIAHWITPATCLERQRRNYHKCFTCAYRGLSAGAMLPVATKTAVTEVPRPVRVPRAV